MKTMLDLDDRLLAKAKSTAATECMSLTRFIEQGIALRLRPQKPMPGGRGKIVLPIYEGRHGLQPGIDPACNRSLYDAAD